MQGRIFFFYSVAKLLAFRARSGMTCEDTA